MYNSCVYSAVYKTVQRQQQKASQNVVVGAEHPRLTPVKLRNRQERAVRDATKTRLRAMGVYLNDYVFHLHLLSTIYITYMQNGIIIPQTMENN